MSGYTKCVKSTAFFLILVVSSLPLRAAIPDQIEAFCSTHDRAMHADLQDLFDRYSNVERRARNPEGYIADVDRVIARMPYSEVLKCREGVPYQLAFHPLDQGEKRMSVAARYTPEGEMTEVRLTFDLTRSVDVAFFNYVHELTHVCQKRDSQDLVRAYYRKYATLEPIEKLYYSTRENAKHDGRPNPEFQDLYDEVKRGNLLGEVDAFFKQLQRFKETLASSSGLCEARGLRFYVNMERDLDRGIFAQNILSSYVGEFADDDPAIYVPDSPLKTYFDQSTNSSYQMRRLNPSMLEAITSLGIDYVEP